MALDLLLLYVMQFLNDGVFIYDDFYRDSASYRNPPNLKSLTFHVCLLYGSRIIQLNPHLEKKIISGCTSNYKHNKFQIQIFQENTNCLYSTKKILKINQRRS